jgi:nitrogen fixation NifU-like protein
MEIALSDLDDLYQELILDHAKHPRNFRDMPDATGFADGHNRMCGDKLRLYVKVKDGLVEDLAFKGDGCSISKASASMMTEFLIGKTVAQAKEVFEKFHHLLTTPEEKQADDLGKLSAFSRVHRYPMRVKCATLPWHTLQAALKQEQTPVSTE